MTDMVRVIIYDGPDSNPYIKELPHEDRNALGLNVVAMVDGTACFLGECSICDHLRMRIKARLGE